MAEQVKVDAFIEKAAPFAQPILRHLRALVHATEPEAGEAIKWGMPHFTLSGKNLCGMGAFKAHCSFIVEGAGERGGDGMGHFGRIAALSDLPEDALLAELIRQRAARIRAGTKAPPRARQPKPEIAMPDDFAAALSAPARAFFDGLSPSCRREYLEWVVGAKRPETRAKRIGEAAGLLAEGKKRYWNYEKC